VVHKMSRPLCQGALWEALRRAGPGRHVLVVRADDLRRVPGVHVSQALSWERTATDLVYQLERLERLQPLRDVPHLVVLFGADGALVRRAAGTGSATLVFDPLRLEGGFAAGLSGSMIGSTAAFTAGLAAELARSGLPGLEVGVMKGLARARALLERGYVRTPRGLAYPWDEVVGRPAETGPFASCAVPRAASLDEPDPGHWRIADELTGGRRRLVAREIVERGGAGALAGAPRGRFGALSTIDRAEIESYGAIRELLLEFLANPKPERPLSVAVFGPPGSGKSFGVKQVMKSLGRPDVEALVFNVSQFLGYADLAAALQKVRDVALRGAVPFIFFDEFDADEGGRPLGWLKYFLAPMQDGQFREGQALYHLGKAIFVFAGGTRASFREFAGSEAAAAPDAKGPDFVSRLRGFVDVMGPDRQPRPGDDDEAFLIRRALVLRAMLEQNPKTSALFDGGPGRGALRIDGGLLRALLGVGRYRHGIRSLEALLDMSRLAGKPRFDLSALPPRAQLALHVDADEFLFLAEQERYQTLLCLGDLPEDLREASYREREETLVARVARGLHEDYVAQRKGEGKPLSCAEAFDDLPEDLRRSNLDAAADVPEKLRKIGCALRRRPAGATPFEPTPGEVEILARSEHDRFWRERRLQGWTWGEQKDVAARVSPYLVPYEALAQDIQEYDRQAVRVIPRVLWGLGYEVYRTGEGDGEGRGGLSGGRGGWGRHRRPDAVWSKVTGEREGATWWTAARGGSVGWWLSSCRWRPSPTRGGRAPAWCSTAWR
ncbi:MAG: RyR domain-containing protein, partial [Deferrisomatales bacterium]